MYARFTAFQYEPDDRDRVESFWRDVGGPVVARRSGFELGLILDSAEAPGVMRTVTVWRSKEDYEALESGADQGPIVDGIRATSLSTTDRDGAGVTVVRPHAGEVRIIRSTVKDGMEADLESYWPEAKAIIESAPGCISADGFVDRDQKIFVLMVTWQSGEDAEAFRESSAHNDMFAPGIERYVDKLDRLRTQPLDKGEQT